jgi:catechol 2,3-dioxygenase-like lactoylglutathione lyase family enzyme
MGITGVQLLSIPVTDQDRARQFYVGTLGLDLVAEEPMGPVRAAGVDVTEPVDAPWGRYVMLHDPDGKGLIVAGPPAS